MRQKLPAHAAGRVTAASYPWHPRLSEKLGLYRFVSMPGSNSTFLTNPVLLATKTVEAGRN